MVKKYVKFFVFIMFLFLLPHSFYAETVDEQLSDQDELIDKQLDRLQMEEISQFWEKILDEYGGYLPESTRVNFMDFVKGDKPFSPLEWIKGLLKFLFHEIFANGQLLGTLILLTVFSMILAQLQNAFEQHNVSKIAYAITYMVLLIFALNSFRLAMNVTENAIDFMGSFMVGIVPILLVLMASTGSVTSATLFHPIVMFLVHTSGVFVQYIVLPLLFLSTILFIVSTMTDHYKVTKLAQFLRNISVGSLGIFLTVFLGVLSVQGATAAIADGIAIKTAKFVTGNFIPVVGKMLTDATDTVMSASILLKNTVGVVGLVILLLICIFPALKVLSLAIIYSFSAAILQPLGGGPIITCLSIIGKSVMFIFAALAAVSLMFFLSITIIVISGNLSLMMQ